MVEEQVMEEIDPYLEGGGCTLGFLWQVVAMEEI